MEQYRTRISSRILAERPIIYHPTIKDMVGNTSSAILLRQINHWWHANHQKPFYKFASRCEHSKYRIGDSWQEELSFKRSELDTALKYIATKIQPKHRFTTPLKACYDNGILAPVTRIVLYWRDRDNVTWYWLNEELQEIHLDIAYAEKAQKYHPENSGVIALADAGFQHPSNADIQHPGMTDSSTTLYTEMNTQKNTEIKSIVSAAQDTQAVPSLESFGFKETNEAATTQDTKERKSSAKKKEKERTPAQQAADAERKRKIAAVGGAYGALAVNDKDERLYLAIYRDLTGGGVPEAEFADYVKRIQRIAKEQRWTVTLPSLTAKGRVSEYVAARDAYRAQQQAQTSAADLAGGWDLRQASNNLKAAHERKG